MSGKTATTYPTALESLGTYCKVVREPFVECGGIATGARCLSGDKLALWIIEKLAGKDISEKVFETVRPLDT